MAADMIPFVGGVVGERTGRGGGEVWRKKGGAMEEGKGGRREQRVAGTGQRE